MRFSVVIPIYNAERTLRRCLNSLLSQLNNEIEVLLINDGSKDASGQICKEFVAKNKSVRYFEQENAGVSVARNVGIDNAQGDYVLFIDSDDYVLADMFSIINRALSEFDYDYAVFPLIVSNGNTDRKEQFVPFESKELDTLIPKISEMICKKQINGPVAKVYKRELLNKYSVRFPIGCSISEDRAFNIIYSLHIRSLKLVNEQFYFATISSNDSLSRTVRSVEELGQHFGVEADAINTAMKSVDLDNKYIQQIKKAENFCACRQVYSRAKRMILRGASRKDIISGIRSDCQEMNSRKLHYPKTLYCKKIYIPVKLRMYRLIYEVAKKLAQRAS